MFYSPFLILNLILHAHFCLGFESGRSSTTKSNRVNLLNLHSFQNPEDRKDKLFSKENNSVFTKSIDLFSVKNIKCKESNCAKPNGYCIYYDTCKCYAGYSNLDTSSEGKFCTHKQKYQLIAFLAEAILSFGIGHLYSGRYINAGLKCGLELLLLVVYFNVKPRTLEIKNGAKFSGNCAMRSILTVLTIIFLAVHIYDVACFSFNNFTDGSGVSLLSWNNLHQE